ncbi:iron ABC transporter permease [Thermosipho ferrireducens]|uniref:Iron ABC transporter permease n=1 Tax=Thermosipho ferrireducens TaxID=2571116 RepID=A0ABX7S7U6_9BACT|nr:iron ABC transporter permease [Thermosipho ferrireducens]QTA37697.1 iron ABC transporter permease [Thermosipho ferrireducens]
MDKSYNWWIIVPIIFVLGGIILPFIYLILFAGGFNPQVLTENVNVIRFTIFQALLSSTITGIIGIPGAYIVARTNLNRFVKSVFRVLSAVPFVLPGVTMAMGFLLTFGREGIFTKILHNIGYNKRILYTFTAVIIGHVFYNFPLFIRIVGETWEKIEGSLSEAAKLDGADNMKTFYLIELPLILPAILKAFLLTYIYTFTSFAVVLILGGIRFSTIEVSIYMYTRILFDFKSAFTLAIFQMLFISIISYFLSIKKGSFISGKSLKNEFPAWGYFYLILATIMIFVPLAYSLLSGFIKYGGGFGVENFKRLFNLNITRFIGATFKQLVGYSIILPGIASLISVLLSAIGAFHSSRGKKLDYIFMLPAAISPVTIAFGYIIMGIKPFFSLIFIYTLITLPIVFGLLENGWRTINKDIEEAAKLDGANTIILNTKIRFPLMKYHLLTAFVYAFTISVGEMSATITTVEPPISTFSVAIYRLLSARKIPEARALNTIYSFIVVVLFMLIEIKRFNDEQ